MQKKTETHLRTSDSIVAVHWNRSIDWELKGVCITRMMCSPVYKLYYRQTGL